MVKRLLFIIIASLLVITGCQPVKDVDLNQLLLSSSKIKSSESYSTASLKISYDKSKVKDKELLKVLNIINNLKVEMRSKVQDAKTVSLEGKITIEQGKIPFQLSMDEKYMVLLLDNASKAIRIPVEQETAQNDEWLKDLQSKLLNSVVKHLPNPKHISVDANTSDKVNGSVVEGHKLHAEIYANEVPDLLLTFLDNLLNDENALTEIVTALNELNKLAGEETPLTVQEVKEGLQQFKDEFNQSLPEMKKSGAFDKRNFLKTDILVDKDFYERKSSTIMTLGKLPADSGGLKEITLKSTSEIWNINESVKAQKINRTKFLSETASDKEFLATLDKKNSVLYYLMTSLMYPQSSSIKSSEVKVSNNKSKADTIKVSKLKKGDVIKVYTSSKGGKLITSKVATGSTASLTVSQLSKGSGKVYVSIIRSGKAESNRTAISYKSEK